MEDGGAKTRASGEQAEHDRLAVKLQKTVKDKELREMFALDGKCSYNAYNKEEFKRLSKKFLREVRTRLGADADVTFNPGGIAVSGDATLHSDTLYLTFNADGICGGLGIMYRKCKGRKDYGTGTDSPNHWVGFEWVKEYGIDSLVVRLKKFMATDCKPNNMKCFASHEEAA